MVHRLVSFADVKVTQRDFRFVTGAVWDREKPLLVPLMVRMDHLGRLSRDMTNPGRKDVLLFIVSAFDIQEFKRLQCRYGSFSETFVELVNAGKVMRVLTDGDRYGFVTADNRAFSFGSTTIGKPPKLSHGGAPVLGRQHQREIQRVIAEAVAI